MATRFTVGKEMKDGSIRSIYGHWDGYPAHAGNILNEHYTELSKIDQLLTLGDLSSLGEDIGFQHDFDTGFEGMCTFYGRDRGETGVGPIVHESLDGWMDYRKGNGCEYGYLWNGVSWSTFKI